MKKTQNFYPNNLSVFPKKPQFFNVLRTLKSLYKLRRIQGKKIDILRLWKFPWLFSKKKTFFPKERNSGTLAEILSKNIIWVGFYIKLAKKKDCEKKTSVSKKTHLFFNEKRSLKLLKISKQKFLLRHIL